MNTLVAYGDESDEDDSPRRRSLDDNEKPTNSQATHSRSNEEAAQERSSNSSSANASPLGRRDSDVWEAFFDDDERPESRGESGGEGFAEPPPPRRQEDEHSPSVTPSQQQRGGMIKVSSSASLAGMEKDTFEREDDRLRRGESRDAAAHASEEPPPPPARASRDSDDEGDDEERQIDIQLEECKDLLRVKGSSPGGSSTPTYEGMSPLAEDLDVAATPGEEANAEVAIPAEPNKPCDPVVEENFRLMFEKKALGFNINKSLQSNKDFLNPSIYELFIEQFGLKEKGSNFPKRLFDPDGFPADCYYDKIAEQQRLLMEKTTQHAKTTAASASDATSSTSTAAIQATASKKPRK